MSSFEIAELTGKEHFHIMRDIRTMLEALGLTQLSFDRSYTDPTGRSLPCFHLPKNLTITLVSGYSIAPRARIVDRWLELEGAVSTPAVPVCPTRSPPHMQSTTPQEAMRQVEHAPKHLSRIYSHMRR